MPPIRVQIAGKGIVEFPDGMTPDDIRAAMLKITAPPAPDPNAAGKMIADAAAHSGQVLDESGKPTQHEPDTYAGGFIKGLRDYYRPSLVKLVQMGQELGQGPTSAGDLASRIALTAVPEFMGGMNVGAPLLDATKGLNLAKAKNQIGKVLSEIGDFDLLHPLKSNIGRLGDYLQQPPKLNFNEGQPGLLKRVLMKREGVPSQSQEPPIPILDGEVMPESPSAPAGPTPPNRPLLPGAGQAQLTPAPAPQLSSVTRELSAGSDPIAEQLQHSLIDNLPGGDAPINPQTPKDEFGMTDADWAAEHDRLMQRFGGRGGSSGGAELGPPSSPSAAPSPSKFPPEGGQGEWHSGAEPGSAEAKSAQSLHRATRELDDLYKLKLSDPLATLLLSLGGGSLLGMGHADTSR